MNNNIIDLEKLPDTIQFIFLNMTLSAIYMKEMKRDKEFFVNFASDIWDSMEMSDLDSLKKIVKDKLMNIENYI
jgi:hypothetical protein